MVIFTNKCKGSFCEESPLHLFFAFFIVYFKIQFCSLPDTLLALQRPPPVRSTRHGLSGIECRPVQRVQRLGGGLHWYLSRPGFGTACHAACAVQSVRVRCGLGSPPLGYMGRAGGGVVSRSISEAQEKGGFWGFVLPTPTPPLQNDTHPIVQVSKNFPKYKKTPFGA